MARVAGTFRQMGDRLQTFSTLVGKRRFTANVASYSKRMLCENEFQRSFLGFDFCQGESERRRRAKKNGKQSFGRTKGGISTKISALVANSTTIVAFRIAPGNFGDGPEGRALLQSLDTSPFEDASLLMDRAYEGDETRALAGAKGFKPVVPPKSNRKEPWEYDKELYKRRNEVERFFRRIKDFRRIATRYEKLDITFTTGLILAFIVILLHN